MPISDYPFSVHTIDAMHQYAIARALAPTFQLASKQTGEHEYLLQWTVTMTADEGPVKYGSLVVIRDLAALGAPPEALAVDVYMLLRQAVLSLVRIVSGVNGPR